MVVRIGLALGTKARDPSKGGGAGSRREEMVMAVAESVEQQADTFVRSPHKLLIAGEWS